jgi:NAD-dependent SIR2 family protein deacetylase
MFPQLVVDGLRAGTYRNIVVLTGAGCSVSSGIPDFRSPGGFYDSLRPELITATREDQHAMSVEPSLVVDINMFKRNQFPYLEVRRPFILGTIEQKWKPTLTHYFFKLLEDKNILQRLYTQNIDGLDYHTGISEDRIVSVHGSINSMSCEECKAPYPQDEFKTELIAKIKNIYDTTDPLAPLTSSNILCQACGQPMVKPDTVLFGTSLPERFFSSVASDFPSSTDLLLVVGTSLVVSPANQLVRMVS